MARIKHFDVHVCVEGEPLPEYEPDEDERENMQFPDKTTIKYIESVSDVEFSFKFLIGPRYKMKCDYLSWAMSVDGTLVGAEVVDKESLPRGRVHPTKKHRHGVISRKGGQDFIENFKFSDTSLEQLPDLEDQLSRDRIKKVGTLTVELWKRKLYYKSRDTAEHSNGFRPFQKLSEKATKGQAISHTVELGPIRPEKPGTDYHGERIGGEPLAVFVFKYRSKRALQDLMIIPRSPSPLPPPAQRPVDNLTVEEMRQLIREQRANETIKSEPQVGIKRERRDSGSPATLAPSPEPRRKRSRMPTPESDSDIEYVGSRSLRNGPIENVSLLDD
ncbi:hypothetical protein FQN54_009589 [Arachnomyces sp. PD_36]|nr:hypothetical protein FQN54_009589 [Arachnomyces sp. PD_36]